MNSMPIPRFLEALEMAAEVYIEFNTGLHPSSRLLADRAFVSTLIGSITPDFIEKTKEDQARFKAVAKVVGLPDPLVPYRVKQGA
ncbi:hypothetical protein [Iodobacter fluviatilis]|uniref:Uncharacterized protein n=1 Tax=Iodobacter fluviatilis TaxID=537 RepID=A0A7G3GE28_9NEIS|nr:hypothetical protein [Iodobacter fluviatilis]QBC42104.1 hypothetical protein C1H71_00040 [Iodobacter fluviatilis]QBC45576.1 hypothetical protein C1H71_19975 [Iodobacter fluviatilis]